MVYHIPSVFYIRTACEFESCILKALTNTVVPGNLDIYFATNHLHLCFDTLVQIILSLLGLDSFLDAQILFFLHRALVVRLFFCVRSAIQ